MDERIHGQVRTGSLARLLALCGVIAPILFILAILIFGLIRPGYSPTRQHISELGEVGAPNAIAFNMTAFLPLGLLMIAFAFGLQRGISKRKGYRLVPILIAVSGIGWMGASVFRCDAGCVNESFTGKMHDLCAILPLFGMLIAPLAILPRLKQDSRWQNYRAFSLIMGSLAAICTAVMFSTAVFQALGPYRGLIQRLTFYTPLLWMEVVAIRILYLTEPPLMQEE